MSEANISENKLHDNWNKVNERLDVAVKSSGRCRKDVTLVAVSKFHAASKIAELCKFGQVDYGESYVQEALAKKEEVHTLLANDCMHKILWHCIGHVQSRKASQVAGEFHLFHALDSIKCAQVMEKKLLPQQKIQRVLVQVNVGDEPQKHGLESKKLKSFVAELMNLPCIKIEGLMCIPPFFDAGEKARPYFAELRTLCENLRQMTGLELSHLSMGMSGDFEQAISEGATLVRVGTDIFGTRE